MAASKTPMKALSAQEQLFVDAYCGPANYNGKKAYEMVLAKDTSRGYWTELDARTVLKRPHVKHAIEQHQKAVSKQMKITEMDILDKLWVEANREGQGANHNARITALVWIGKHLGMFQEKKQEVGPNTITYNIVNYSEAPTQEKVIENKKQESVVEVENNLPANIQITSYAINQDKEKDQED
jgi:hypothetical protein